MKIQLPKQEIEKFLELCQYVDVTSESIVYSPITEFIKIELKNGFCKLVLTSSSNFIQYAFFCEDKSNTILLVSYFLLKKFYSNKRKDILIISDTEKKTNVSDGVFSLNYIKPIGIELSNCYTQPNTSGLNYSRISKKNIDLINISKNYIKAENKDKLIPFLNHSNILGNKLLSSDAHISFLYKLDEEFPYMFFSKLEIELIRNFDYFDYNLMDNWNIIKYGNIVFGKRIIDGITPLLYEQINSYISYSDKKKVLKVNSDQFTEFCKSVKSFIVDDTINSYLEVSEKGVELSYEDKKNSIDRLSQIIDCQNSGYEIGYKICFVHSSIVKVLDSIKSNTINISECIEPNGRNEYICFWLDSDSNFHSICSKGFQMPNN